ncbi:hypothetical protein [Candidatus Palauibacter sp.]
MLLDAAHHAGVAPGAVRLATGTGVFAVAPLKRLACLEIEKRPPLRGRR